MAFTSKNDTEISFGELALQTDNNELRELNLELRRISASQSIRHVQSGAHMADLKDIGVMLVKVQKQMESLHRSEGVFRRMVKRMPVINKFVTSFEEELALQQSITEYATATLNEFDSKYKEIVIYIREFEETRNALNQDVASLKDWIDKANAMGEKLANTTDKLILSKLITEAKSEFKRKSDQISMINPMITSATYFADQINVLSPMLADILHTELKTAAGVNAFRSAAATMKELKTTIKEMQKLNTSNITKAIIDVLGDTKENLMAKADYEELDKLKLQSIQEINKAVAEVKKAQEENKLYIDRKYKEMQEQGLILEGNRHKFIRNDDIIDVHVTQSSENTSTTTEATA